VPRVPRLSVVASVVALLLTSATFSHAQPNAAPFSLPFAAEPGPATWMFEQHYGNTQDAFNFGPYWYVAGQGLHFGVDFEAPCGTPVVAIADGVVDQIDNRLFGAEPHNLVIRHEQFGYVSVYGHLRDEVRLQRGQPVRRGDPVGVVGDPDVNCRSRPHLHLEIRSLDFRTAYNPLPLIKADWDMLYSLHQPEVGGFAKDARRPARWQFGDEQPEVSFNDGPLNDYALTWPPPYRQQAPPVTLPATVAPPLATNTPLSFRRLTPSGCCTRPWWSVDSQAVYYVANSAEADVAGVYQVALPNPTPQLLGTLPPATIAPNGAYEARVLGSTMTLIHLATGQRFPLFTRGAYPRFSPGSTRLLWHIRPADDIPGEIAPRTEIWVAEVATGEGRRLRLQSGGSVRWLDEDRLLLVEVAGVSQAVTLSILTISTGEVQALLTTTFMRALSVAPGGKQLMFASIFQERAALNGVYLLETRPGAVPRKLPFFGGWRWRDSRSVIYVPFNAPSMGFVLYDLQRHVSVPIPLDKFESFHIATADWDISPDGRRVMFVEARDRAIWVVELPIRDWF
jgi:murein DD-endopeptidase MepM/ murein hydrolase activator NlpD